MCGEKMYDYGNNTAQFGSPPRVRGKDAAHQGFRRAGGITPACAGKRWPSESPCLSCRDHPRVCGEKSWPCIADAVPPGSPPRMRGKVLFLAGNRPGHRITPACAGKRLANFCAVGPVKDHPRVCGEKSSRLPRRLKNAGLPPRVRGKAGCSPAAGAPGGITPACAGKRAPSWQSRPADKDHPRVCGEKG